MIGITGIIGSGKTTASQALKKKGIPVIDLDAVAKEVLTLKEVHEDIERAFGQEFVKNGAVVVEKLREAVFTNKEKLRILEAIIHPRVIEQLWKTITEP